MPALSLSKVGGRERKRTSPRCVKVEREKNTGPGLRILEEGEMIYCAVLGFQIDRAACASSGNHLICRVFSGRKLVQNAPPEKPRKLLKTDSESNPPQAIKSKARKRCECGRAFSLNSNRQRFCKACGERNEAMKNRQRQARFRKRVKTGLGVTV